MVIDNIIYKYKLIIFFLFLWDSDLIRVNFDKLNFKKYIYFFYLILSMLYQLRGLLFIFLKSIIQL